jgi:hypothetical protein
MKLFLCIVSPIRPRGKPAGFSWRLLYNNQEISGIIPAYIMRLTKEIQKWNNYFSSYAKQMSQLETKAKEILENIF